MKIRQRDAAVSIWEHYIQQNNRESILHDTPQAGELVGEVGDDLGPLGPGQALPQAGRSETQNQPQYRQRMRAPATPRAP